MYLLNEWKQADQTLKEAKKNELNLRKKLSAELFGEYPTEGTHRDHGVKLTQKYTKTIVDLDGLLNFRESAVKAKYSLVASEYAPDLDQFLELKPSTPALKFEGGDQ